MPSVQGEPLAVAKLSAADRQMADEAEACLANSLELWEWWRRTDADDGYAERFLLSTTHKRPDSSFGFFGDAKVGGRHFELMGNVQEQFFDRPKIPAAVRGEDPVDLERRSALWMRDQVREFVLRYFLRVSDFLQPEVFTEETRDAEPAPAWMEPFSWCSRNAAKVSGFGYEQVLYRTLEGEIGRFSDDERYAIVDLRELAGRYAWIVLKVDIFDFLLELTPFGHDHPYGVVPLREASYLVISPRLVIDDARPGPGELGRYGFAYGFLPSHEESLLAYGPGRFEAAFQLFEFVVKESGEVLAQLAFVANRPQKIVDVALDPVRWGLRAADALTFGGASRFFGPMTEKLPRPPSVDVVSGYLQLANVLTGGVARRRLCINREQLERSFLVKHFRQHYNVIASSLVTWRQIPDWTARDRLPSWAESGRT